MSDRDAAFGHMFDPRPNTMRNVRITSSNIDFGTSGPTNNVICTLDSEECVGSLTHDSLMSINLHPQSTRIMLRILTLSSSPRCNLDIMVLLIMGPPATIGMPIHLDKGVTELVP